MNIINVALAAVGLFGVRQDTPQEINKRDLPAKTHCTVCEAKGDHMGLEHPAAGVRYKGHDYFFCKKEEVAEFKADPEAFLPPVLPRPLPDLSVSKFGGESLSLKSLRGKVVLLDYWATWCKPCIETMPAIQKLQDKYGESGLVAMGVSIDEGSDKKPAAFVAKRKFTYPMAWDGGARPVWKALKVVAVPALFLVNRQGQIVKQWVGKPLEKEVEDAVIAELKRDM